MLGLLHFATWCYDLDLRQSLLALTLPSDNAAAPDDNQAKLFQVLCSVIPNVLLIQACCQARRPLRTHSLPIRIWQSLLLLAMPARPSKTAMPNYPELHVKIFSNILLLQSKGLLWTKEGCLLDCPALLLTLHGLKNGHTQAWHGQWSRE